MLKNLRLTINNHHDACVISNAVREYCRQQADTYHWCMLQYLEKGEKEKAKELQKMRDAVTLCGDRTLARLDKILRRFENFFEPFASSNGSYDYNSCPGDVGARDSF